MACLSNNVVIAEILIAKGADLNALNTVSKIIESTLVRGLLSIIVNFVFNEKKKYIFLKLYDFQTCCDRCWLSTLVINVRTPCLGVFSEVTISDSHSSRTRIFGNL